MQTKLAQLRSQLHRLAAQRAAVRWGSGICVVLAMTIWLLTAAFVFDWSFNLPLWIRAVALIGWLAGTSWTFKVYAWPLISERETVEDVALVVERHHKIDSDLVAAIQFEQPDAGHWGSTRLSSAVIDYVAEFSPSLDVFAGFTYESLPRRAAQLCFTLFIVIAATIAYPGHVTAFWNRFWLGAQHYPTKTRLEKIVINQTEVPVFTRGKPARITVPQGQPIALSVTCGGVIPSKGTALLSGRRGDLNHQVDLNPRSEQGAQFFGEIGHASDSFRVRFQLGDAVSDQADVEIVPLPLVDLAWDVKPPAYARQSLKTGDLEGTSRQLAVLEGSGAELKLTCSNKSLKSAELIAGHEVMALRPRKAAANAAEIWQLPPGTPFESIHEAIKYEIRAIDEDGLSPAAPITGQIRLKSDRQPRIVATAVTRQVLPAAVPRVDYLAADDFGIVRIVAQVSITREDGRSSQHEIVAKSLSPTDQLPKTLRGQVAIPLSQYELTKGDEVKVLLEVTDWRGDLDGQKSVGETISFSVTDLNGILAQTGEEDKKTAKELDEILRRELGISGEKK